ncbi:MAG TPA: TetR family transcriptional regulator [Kineosporiaceae bacterium]|nr:TetR family transcriptional regulator [Kineosporiaceae bacterium]
MTATGGQEAIRRRGRRPAGEDTRQAIVDAARTEFATRGYEGTTMRGVARAAGVDARLVHHYFDGKDEVFAAAMELPVRPREIVDQIINGSVEELGERLVRFFFAVWDAPAGRERIVALLASALTSQDAARLLREFLAREIFGRVAAELGSDDPQLRAALAASQMVGVIVARYVVKIEPLASADQEDLVPILGPTIQRYLYGQLS